MVESHIIPLGQQIVNTYFSSILLNTLSLTELVGYGILAF